MSEDEKPETRYMLQVRRLGLWLNWWPDLVTPGQLRQAGGFSGIVGSLREAPRPFRGAVRLVEYRLREATWVRGEVTGSRGKAGRGRHA